MSTSMNGVAIGTGVCLLIICYIVIPTGDVHSANSLYYSLALGLYFQFPWLVLTYCGLSFAFAYCMGRMMVGLAGFGHQYEMDVESAARLLFIATGYLILFLLWGSFAGGAYYHTNFSEDCWPENCPPGRGGGLTFLWYGLDGLYYILLISVLPVLAGAAIATSPVWMAGFVVIRSTHPADQSVSRTVGMSQSDARIERELGQIMERQDETDIDIERKISQLSPTRRYTLGAVYRSRAKDAKELEALARAKTDVLQAEDELARRVHELERAKRAKGSWRYGR